ncbi:UNVERIFIED_CONTAM: THO complex subunit [Sesamum radiatum]|uniref:THO complex subunit n=1 Tax=Sesamum radiatum TaxID=300843 RepID=A0AAW2VAQ3_SESRA
MHSLLALQKQVKLVQDENQLLENMLRTLLQELVSAAVQSGEEIMQYGQSIADGETRHGQIPRLLDIVLYLCEKEHVEGGMIFQLLEDLTEMSTMRNCKDIFGYIESKQDILGKPELFARGKLVMLRTCNQLLRRLSKVVLLISTFTKPFGACRCGRAYSDVYLVGSEKYSIHEAHDVAFPFWPYVNISIKLSKKEEERTLFPTFGNSYMMVVHFGSHGYCSLVDYLVEFFSNPASIMPALTKWHKFTSSLTVVLNTFEAQPLSDEEGNAINLEDESSNFSIKYLTSSNLMGLELKDPSFRRHVLVQCLILFDYLKAPGKNEKDLPSDTMKEEIKTCEERVKKLLETTPPRGKEFLHSIEHILERERNWVWWKRDGCPPFEKQPIEKKLGQDGGRKRRPRWRLGNKELSQLWKWADQNPNALTDPQRVRTPAIMDYWKPLAEDMDESAGIEEEYHHKNNRVYCWKGLRFSARQDLEGFSRFTEHGIEGVVPLELLPADVRSKYQAKPGDRSKRAKKEETKGSVQQVEESQIATPASETEADGSRIDPEASAAPAADTDAMVASGSLSQGGTPTPDEHQKQSSDTDVGLEAGQIEADTEAEAGMVDGETDAEVDLDVVA